MNGYVGGMHNTQPTQCVTLFKTKRCILVRSHITMALLVSWPIVLNGSIAWFNMGLFTASSSHTSLHIICKNRQLAYYQKCRFNMAFIATLPPCFVVSQRKQMSLMPFSIVSRVTTERALTINTSVSWKALHSWYQHPETGRQGPETWKNRKGILKQIQDGCW